MANLLKFITQPEQVKQGHTLRGGASNNFERWQAGIQVGVYDVTGTILQTSDATSVTMAIGTNPTSGSALSGTLVQPVLNGYATFGDLAISLGGTGYTLTASDSGYTSATSNAFNVLNVYRVNPAMLTLGALTGTGTNIGPYHFRPNNKDFSDVSLRVAVTGTFVGTVAIIVCDPGATPTGGYTAVSVTAPTSQAFIPAGACDIYANMSAFTSGSATVEIWY